ncbi:thiamine phosphate synthase [Spirochaetota bacterium]
MNNKIYAAIDANINRAMEGLRVCEDVLRFILLSPYSHEIKEVRHEVRKSCRVFPAEMLLRARDVNGDSQKFFDLDDELRRTSVSHIFSANLHRSIEAVRALEEFAKNINETSSQDLQKIRFLLYDIEKKVQLNLNKSEWLDKFSNSLYAILDSSFVEKDDYSGAAKKMIEGGALIIQLRMKGEPRKKVLQTAKEISLLCMEHKRIFIVNDHPDIALLSGARGLHLGQDDISVDEAKKIMPQDMIIGKSTHSYEEAIDAVKEGPDYIAIGPVYSTKSKNGKEIGGIGTEVLGKIMETVEVPTVAIGGITLKGTGDIKKRGCTCIAVISELYINGKIKENCCELVKAIG